MQLSDAERRELARIERHLAAEDPALARALSGGPAETHSARYEEAEPDTEISAVITLSLPVVGQQAAQSPAPTSRRAGRLLMAAGAATVAFGLLTGSVVGAVAGFLVVALGKFAADR